MSFEKDRAFDHILIIMFENQYRGYVLENAYFRGLAQQGIELCNYYGNMHPSQTNYISSIAGELCNVTYDDAPPPLMQNTIVDLIEASPLNLRWKAYMQSYIPQNQPWTKNLVPKDAFPYVIKHNPFSSFANIQNNQRRWANIVDESRFWSDLINGDFPEYAWFTPNMWNDGHYLDGTQTAPNERAPVLVDQAARWLQGFFEQLCFPGSDSHLPDNTLVVVTFDEADFEADWEVGKKYTYDGPNQVYTVLLGEHIQPAKQKQSYNHYSLLKTIEKNFQLETLGKNDSSANWFQFLWHREFNWHAPVEAPIHVHKYLAAAALGDTLYVIYQNDQDELLTQACISGVWSQPWASGYHGSGAIALLQEPANGRSEASLLLAYTDEDGCLSAARYYETTGWQADSILISEQPVKLISATGFDKGIMVVWSEQDSNKIMSRVCIDLQWQDPVETGHCVSAQSTQGSIAISSIGPCVYLIIENNGESFVSSYNMAEYNAVTVAESSYSGPWDNTVCDQWSKNLFPLARFGAEPSNLTSAEPEPVTVPYQTGTPLVAAELDGVIHLIHPGAGNATLLSETFSIAGIMTAELPVSYNAKQDKTTSNGYGTLAEAGWAEPIALPACRLQKNGVLQLNRVGTSLVLLFQSECDGRIFYCSGSYIRRS